MRTLLTCLVVLVAATVVASTAVAAGSDPTARATFLGTIRVDGAKATLKVRYRCGSGQTLWISAKQTTSGRSAARLMKEGSSRGSAAWWDSHRNRISCNGAFHTTTFSLDHVEKGTKGQLRPGTAWVQFCVTKGHTQKDTVLTLSTSGWVHVSA